MADGDSAIVQEEAKSGMEKALRSLRSDLQKVRTGRANAALLDGIQVDYYGMSSGRSRGSVIVQTWRISSSFCAVSSSIFLT